MIKQYYQFVIQIFFYDVYLHEHRIWWLKSDLTWIDVLEERKVFDSFGEAYDLYRSLLPNYYKHATFEVVPATLTSGNIKLNGGMTV